MIFITGCNGFIGSFIARKLLSQGEKIIALRRKSSDFSLIKDIESSIQWLEGDISETEILNKAMEQADTVIHAAAIISFSPKLREKMYKVNVEGTANVVNAALKNKVKKFCYISSIAALGRKKGETMITEKALWEESDMNTHYAKSKYLAELEVWRAIEEGLPAVIVNPSVVLGAGNWENGSTKLFHYVYNQNKFFTKGYISYVDVQDVAGIVIELLKRNTSIGERYILNGGRVTYQELFTLMARYFMVKPPAIQVGKILAEIAWRVEGIRTMFSSSEPILTKETARLSEFSFVYKSEKIKEFLNYEFTPLEKTIAQTCRELKDRYVYK